VLIFQAQKLASVIKLAVLRRTLKLKKGFAKIHGLLSESFSLSMHLIGKDKNR
jgi:hypothetical protein